MEGGCSGESLEEKGLPREGRGPGEESTQEEMSQCRLAKGEGGCPRERRSGPKAGAQGRRWPRGAAGGWGKPRQAQTGRRLQRCQETGTHSAALSRCPVLLPCPSVLSCPAVLPPPAQSHQVSAGWGWGSWYGTRCVHAGTGAGEEHPCPGCRQRHIGHMAPGEGLAAPACRNLGFNGRQSCVPQHLQSPRHRGAGAEGLCSL